MSCISTLEATVVCQSEAYNVHVKQTTGSMRARPTHTRRRDSEFLGSVAGEYKNNGAKSVAALVSELHCISIKITH